jgi:aldehyde:ferredoxin oxidoreductase
MTHERIHIQGLSLEFQDNLVKEYYALQGWDEGGVPTPEGLAQLGITEDFVSLSV